MDQFLATVVETAANRLKTLREGDVLFRAQRGATVATIYQPSDEERSEPIEVENGAPLSSERMTPRPEFVGDGRVNPRSIPCLYLGTTESAVISEMRPWVGAFITIARFRLARQCTLVDCSESTTQSWMLEQLNLNLNDVDQESAVELSKRPPTAQEKENAVWGDIGYAFSRPVTRDEPHLDYIPTQIMAEAFRSRGWDGILYKSLLDSEGKNIALFDVNAGIFVDSCLYRTHSAAFTCVREESRDGYAARASCKEKISSYFEERLPF